MFCGFYAMVAAINGKFVLAAYAIVIASDEGAKQSHDLFALTYEIASAKTPRNDILKSFRSDII